MASIAGSWGMISRPPQSPCRTARNERGRQLGGAPQRLILALLSSLDLSGNARQSGKKPLTLNARLDVRDERIVADVQLVENTVAGCSLKTGRKEISAAARLTTRTATVPANGVNHIIRNGYP